MPARSGVVCLPPCMLAGLQHAEMVRRTLKVEEMARAKARRLAWAELVQK